MTLRPFALTALALALGGALPLGGCGKMGELDRPGPLFGAGRNTTREADEAQRQVTDPNRQVNTVDPRDSTSDPAPSRTIPMEGTAPNPFQTAPQGALPDPYANPR